MHVRHWFSGLVAVCLGLVSAGCAMLRNSGDLPETVPEAGAGVMLQKELQASEDLRFVSRFQLVEEGSAPVSLKHAEDGRAFVSLPVNFGVGNHRRVAWDIAFKDDWGDVKTVVFDFYVRPQQSASGLMLYLHSGDGWYLCGFGVDRPEGWNRIELDASSFTTEDRPGGWKDIDVVRISSWRGDSNQDGWFGLANFGVKRSPKASTKVVIIQADSCRAKEPGSKSYTMFAARMRESLMQCGLEAHLVSDRDVTPGLLQNYRLAILPNNPSLPAPALKALQGFVARGGKIFGCYYMPVEINNLLGLTFKGNGLITPETGRFGGILATKQALKGQPAFVRQASWLARSVRAGKGRVLATWQSAGGKDTGDIALLKVPNGIYLSHVWTPGRGGDQRELMEAIISEYIPVDQVSRLRQRLAQIGRQDRGGDWQSLVSHVEEKGNAEARASLVQADALKRKASGLLDRGDWLTARKVIEQAEQQAHSAYFLTLDSVSGEERLFWCHDAAGMPGWSWDRAIKYLADCGFTAIIPNMCWGGVAYYDSKVLPRYGAYEQFGDRVKECLAACKKYGLSCHVWKVCFNMGASTKEFMEAMTAAGRVQVSRSGKVNKRWLCPTHPLNQKMEIDTMVELTKNYPDLDGVHFDYIRYSNSDVCYCAGCRQRFEAYLGRKLKAWPFDSKDKALQASWEDFRRQAISHVVKTAHQQVKAIRPTMKISAAVFQNMPGARKEVGQDWEFWCQQGWLDFICPMDYKEYDRAFDTLMTYQKRWNHGVRMYPGIGISCWKNPNAYRLARQIELVRRQGLKGFTVFNYDQCVLEPLQYLKLGCTKKK